MENTAVEKKQFVDIILVGRGDKMAYIGYERGAKKNFVAKVKAFSMPYLEAMFTQAALLIDTCREKGISLTLYTVDQVAIAGYNLRAVKNSGEKEVQNFIPKFLLPKEEDSDEILEVKRKTALAYGKYANAILKFDNEEEIFLRVVKASEFKNLNLEVPKGVELQIGQRLQFVDGVSVNPYGVKVAGWKNFASNNAVVLAKTIALANGESKTSFYIERSTKSGYYAVLSQALAYAWAQVPKAEEVIEPIEFDVEEETFTEEAV